MATTPVAFIESKVAEIAETTQYTSPAGTKTAIDKFTAYNSTVTGITLTVRLVASGGAAGAGNATVAKVIQPGKTETFAELVGHNLEAGDFVSTLASATGLVIRGSGRQFT